MMANRFSKWTILCGVLLASAKISSSSNGEKIPDNALYFGWFFSEPIAASLKEITNGYLEEAYKEVPEVRDFLNNLSPDALNYYQKPLDPNTRKYDPHYHVTAMYCGRKDCSNYYDKIEPAMNTSFEMTLIGVFFTKKTYGVRVLLTQEELEMTDESPENSVTKVFPPKNADDFPGIKFIPQPANFAPSATKAHITLGVAPGIPAVQTGPDLQSIVKYETNPEDFNHDEFQVQNIGTLRRYYPQQLQNETLAFVYYLDNKMVTHATFEAYIKTKKTEAG